MKKLDLFVLKSFLGPLVLTFFIVLIILILQFLWMYVDELVGKGLDIKTLAELIYNFGLTFVPMALPLAILLASLMTFGNMGEFSELTALKASGIPLQRIMRPLIFVLAFFAIISFFFSNNVLPYATDNAKTLLLDIRRKKPDINIQAGSFYNGVPGYSIKVTRKDPETNKLEDLIIYEDSDQKGNVSVTTADSGFMSLTKDESGLIMTLYNGFTFVELEEKQPGQNLRKFPSRKDLFKVQTMIIPLTGFDLERSENSIFKSKAETQNISQLTYYIDSLNKEYSEEVENQLLEFNQTKIFVAKNSVRIPKVIESDDFTATSVFNPATLIDSLNPFERRTVLARSIENLKDAAGYLTMSTEALYYDIKTIKRYEVEWNKKLTLSFACLVFFFIGAPLGAIIRKGGLGTPAVISILFFVIYYVISITAQKLVEDNIVSTFAGMWAASYILLPIGIYLTYKATSDSVILNVDKYIEFLKKIKDYLYRNFMNMRNEESVTD